MKYVLKYNYKGQIVTNKSIALQDPAFGWCDESGVVHVKWDGESSLRDKNGFSKLHPVSDIVLPKGTIICRYGNVYGYFTAPKGSDYDKLALPYKKETIEYHEYEVLSDVSVACFVKSGIVAAMFNSPGGATQYLHRNTIQYELANDIIKEVFTWLQER